MFRLKLSVGVVALLALVMYCSAGEKDVLDLTDADFDEKIAQNENVLVMFYAPWCGHCKRLKPEYAKAAEELLRNDPPVVLAKIDCTEAGKETCNTHSVSGYPTLKIFQQGEMTQEYGGPREAAGIVKYMRAQVGPASKEISTAAELDKYLAAERDAAIIGFFEKETSLKGTFLQLANKLREKIRFAHTTFKDLLEREGETDGVVLYRANHLANKFEASKVVYSGKPSVSDMSTWISETRHGLAGHRRSDNRLDFVNPLVTAYYAVDYEKNAKGTNYWRNRVLKVAEKFADKSVRFAVSAKDEFQQELNEHGIDFVGGDKPIVLARDADNQKYVMKDAFSVEALETFVSALLGGELEPYIKSEPVPEPAEHGAVKVAVARNFEELVSNSGRDALVEFYAPWCGHCKKLAPAYDELAKKLADEDIDIVKMDATANDVPPKFEVRGFPTIVWKAADGSVSKYESGRDVDDFIKYIAKHATDELKGWDRSGKLKKEEL